MPQLPIAGLRHPTPHPDSSSKTFPTTTVSPFGNSAPPSASPSNPIGKGSAVPTAEEALLISTDQSIGMLWPAAFVLEPTTFRTLVNGSVHAQPRATLPCPSSGKGVGLS